MKSLNKDELSRLLQVAKERSLLHYLAILMSFNHGLRVSELTQLRAGQIKDGYLTVQRLKGSLKTVQPLVHPEGEVLKILYPSVDPSERLFKFSARWMQKLMHKYGELAGIPYHKSHPHILKTTCGTLGLKSGMKINEVQTYLGHKSLASTGAYLVVDDDEASEAFGKALGEIWVKGTLPLGIGVDYENNSGHF